MRASLWLVVVVLALISRPVAEPVWRRCSTETSKTPESAFMTLFLGSLDTLHALLRVCLGGSWCCDSGGPLQAALAQ